MSSTQEVVHPATRLVPVAGGRFSVSISPWTMAQRASLRPKLLALIDRVTANTALKKDEPLPAISELFAFAEEELMGIAQTTATLPVGRTWDDLYWEDLPVIVQAIWEVCVVRGGDQGVAGKLMSVLGRSLGALLLSQSSSLIQTPKKSPGASSQGSPSSPAAGAPTLSDSVTL